MLKCTKIALLILIPCLASAQSVSISPYNFEAWGELDSSTIIGVEYKIVGLHMVYVHKEQYSGLTKQPTPRYMFGLSVMSPRIKDVFRGGIMYFTDPFPTPTDTRLNAFLEASYEWKDVRLFFRHISNAGTGDTNHGIDYIGVSVHL